VGGEAPGSLPLVPTARAGHGNGLSVLRGDARSLAYSATGAALEAPGACGHVCVRLFAGRHLRRCVRR
jgi:hypothetical protein